MTALVGALLLAAVPQATWTPPIEEIEPPPASALPEAPPPEEPSRRPDLAEADRHKRFFITLVETTLVVGTGTLWYWYDGPSQSTWDLHFDWTSWKRKVDFSAVRFDADRFDTNASSHPRAGLYYYQVARGNGFNFAQAYLWTFVTSLIWEYLIEFNENPSINDMILTPAAGSVVGESTFRLGRFFATGAPTITNKVGSILFAPFAALDDFTFRRRPAHEAPYDALGFTRAFQHRFIFALDQLACVLDGKRSDQTSIALDTELVTYRAYRAPGRGWGTVYPGQWSELAGQLLLARGGGERGIAFHSGTLLAGRYFRHYAEPDAVDAPPTRPRGWGTLLGLGSTFDYTLRDLEIGQDRVASAGLLGPTTELLAERGNFAVRLSLAGYYSFALVESLAYMAKGDPSSTAAINTTLHDQGYYYAHGLTSYGALALQLGDLELGLVATYGAFWSLNGRDRFQERLAADLSAADTRASGAATAGLRPFGGPVLIAGRLERFERYGRLSGVSATSDETRAGLGAGLVF